MALMLGGKLRQVDNSFYHCSRLGPKEISQSQIHEDADHPKLHEAPHGVAGAAEPARLVGNRHGCDFSCRAQHEPRQIHIGSPVLTHGARNRLRHTEKTRQCHAFGFAK